MKKKVSNKLLIVIFIVVFLLVFLVLHLMFGFKKKVIHDNHSPGVAYYCYRSNLTGLYYCEVHHGCSAIECPSNDTSYEIRTKGYFDFLGGHYA